MTNLSAKEVELIDELVDMSGDDICEYWGDAKYPFCYLGKNKYRYVKLGANCATGCVSQIAYNNSEFQEIVAEGAKHLTKDIKEDIENIFNFGAADAPQLWDSMSEDERIKAVEVFIEYQRRYDALNLFSDVVTE